MANELLYRTFTFYYDLFTLSEKERGINVLVFPT